MALVKQHIEPHINGNAHIAAGADAGGVKGGNGRAASPTAHREAETAKAHRG